MSGWDEFRAGLAAALLQSSDRVKVIVSRAGSPITYVQFAVFSDNIWLEASGPKLVPVSPDQAARMVSVGWSAPSASDEVNWHQILEVPALSSAYVEVAEACVVALRDVFGVALVAELACSAWRDAEVSPNGFEGTEEDYAAFDTGDDSLAIPSLSFLASK